MAQTSWGVRATTGGLGCLSLVLLVALGVVMFTTGDDARTLRREAETCRSQRADDEDRWSMQVREARADAAEQVSRATLQLESEREKSKIEQDRLGAEVDIAKMRNEEVAASAYMRGFTAAAGGSDGGEGVPHALAGLKEILDKLREKITTAETLTDDLTRQRNALQEELQQLSAAVAEAQTDAENAKEEAAVERSNRIGAEWEAFTYRTIEEACMSQKNVREDGCAASVRAALAEQVGRFRACVEGKGARPLLADGDPDSAPKTAVVIYRRTAGRAWWVTFCDPALPER